MFEFWGPEDDSIESKHVAHVSIVVDIAINCCVRLLHLVPIERKEDKIEGRKKSKREMKTNKNYKVVKERCAYIFEHTSRGRYCIVD